jgi:glycerol-3-phosphate dehydrogenase (NAD(P)+)
LKNLAVIGGGSWGTALAIVLAPRFARTSLWIFEPDLAQRVRATRINDTYLPSCEIPSNVDVTSDLEITLADADVVLSVVPSHLVRSVYERMLPFLRESMLFASATKGLENGTLLQMSSVIRQVVRQSFDPRVAVISGPTFAKEVARLDPTALVVASDDPAIGTAIQSAFSGPTFRLYTSLDTIGVEIGGSIKNVVAIAAGVLEGMGLGHNATAALITRGLAEMTRLAVAMGGRNSTLAGLAGLGDLVLTCTGDLSRNRNVGIELAKGRKLEEIVGSMRMVAEGVKTTNAARELAERHGVEMPITEQMHQILNLGISPGDAVRRLMVRALKGE